MTTSYKLSYPSTFVERFMDDVAGLLDKVHLAETGLVSGWIGHAFVILISHPRIDADAQMPTHTIMVRNLYVKPVHRNQRLAAKTLAKLMELAGEHGITLWGDAKPYSLMSGPIETAEEYNLDFDDEQIDGWKAALMRMGWVDAEDETMPDALVFRPEGAAK